MSLCYIGPVNDSFDDVELTPRMAELIRVFLEDPLKERYGYDLMQATGLRSGTLYPILAKLRADGWLAVGTEDIDPRAAGRPARRYYQISAAAVPAARAQLAALSARYWVPASAPRLATEGGRENRAGAGPHSPWDVPSGAPKPLIAAAPPRDLGRHRSNPPAGRLARSSCRAPSGAWSASLIVL